MEDCCGLGNCGTVVGMNGKQLMSASDGVCGRSLKELHLMRPACRDLITLSQVQNPKRVGFTSDGIHGIPEPTRSRGCCVNLCSYLSTSTTAK